MRCSPDIPQVGVNLCRGIHVPNRKRFGILRGVLEFMLNLLVWDKDIQANCTPSKRKLRQFTINCAARFETWQILRTN